MTPVLHYQHGRPRIRTGDLLSFRGGWWLSSAIRWWTGRWAPHARLMFGIFGLGSVMPTVGLVAVGCPIGAAFFVIAALAYCLARSVDPAPVSHVACAVWAALEGHEPRLMVMESTGGGVRLMPLSELVRTYNAVGGAVFWQECLDAGEGREAADRIAAMLGQAYPSDYQYAVIASRLLRAIRRWRGKSLDVDDQAVTCSECMAAGWGLPEPALVTPVQVTECGKFRKPLEVLP